MTRLVEALQCVEEDLDLVAVVLMKGGADTLDEGEDLGDVQRAGPRPSRGDHLAQARRLVAQRIVTLLQPIEPGGEIGDGPAHAAALKAHRQLRNEQVVTAVGKGARSIGAIVRAIYPSQSLMVRRAAGLTVTAHVEYLEARGQLQVSRRPWGMRFTP